MAVLDAAAACDHHARRQADRARRCARIDWSPVQAEKGGYKHFMLKEIHEQPRAIEDTLRGRIDLENGDVSAPRSALTRARRAQHQARVLVACGTSYHAAMVGRYYCRALARVPATVELASEFRARDPVIGAGDLVVAVSQSGETLGHADAPRRAKKKGAKVLAIANVIGSAIPRVADGALYTHAGPEIGVASTKCFTTQLVRAAACWRCTLGRRRGHAAARRARRVARRRSCEMPHQMRDVLCRAPSSSWRASRGATSTRATCCSWAAA